LRSDWHEKGDTDAFFEKPSKNEAV